MNVLPKFNANAVLPGNIFTTLCVLQCVLQERYRLWTLLFSVKIKIPAYLVPEEIVLSAAVARSFNTTASAFPLARNSVILQRTPLWLVVIKTFACVVPWTSISLKDNVSRCVRMGFMKHEAIFFSPSAQIAGLA